MGGFPSGQRGQTVNLLAQLSKVRILLRPLKLFFYLRERIESTKKWIKREKKEKNSNWRNPMYNNAG